MKQMEEAGKPGDQHKALEPLIGNWNSVVKCWMQPGEPTVTKGSSETKWILDGRFVQENFTGDFMGKPFHGIAITGFDKMKQKYNNFWIDTMSTATFITEGTSGNGKEFTFTGKMDCPMTGEKDMPVRQVVRIESPDKHVMEMFATMEGKEQKTMEITYTRK